MEKYLVLNDRPSDLGVVTGADDNCNGSAGHAVAAAVHHIGAFRNGRYVVKHGSRIFGYHDSVLFAEKHRFVTAQAVCFN